MKEGWEYKKLGEVCNVIGGGTPDTKNKEYWRGNIPWATVSDMNCDVIKTTGYYITDRGLNESSSRIIKKGEIVIATRVGLGKVCKLAVDTAINQDLKGVIPKDNNIVRDFIFYYFKHKAKYIVDNGIGATVKGVKIKFIEGLSFGFPSLSKQQSIVNYLDAAFAKIDAMKANAEKALNEAKALFQASLKEMLEPKEGCEENTLKTICIFSQGIQVPLSNQFENKGEGLTRFLRIIDFTQGNEPPRYVQIVDRKYWLEKDGIAIVRYGASTGYICTGLEGTLANNLFKVTIKDGIKLFYKYLFWWLNSKTFQSEIKKQMNGAAMPAISFGMINDIKINFPSLQEQQSIVATLDSLKSKVDRLQENFDKISQECDVLKQAILRQVFE